VRAILKSLIEHVTKSRRLSPAQPLPESTSAIEPQTLSSENNSEERQPERSALGTGDAPAKIASSRCDVHPLYRLHETIIDPVSPDVPTTKTPAHCCTKAGCRRVYLRKYGYFQFQIGELTDFGDLKAKAACNLNHELRYMVVTKVNDNFVWACPEAGCSNAVAYAEPSET
jgi:hypothetical protein